MLTPGGGTRATEDGIVRQRAGRALCAAAATLTLGACTAGWGGGAGDGGTDSINVLMVNNPQMVDLQRLTAEHFTEETGIKVNFTVLPENDVRGKISQEFSSQAGQYDVASLSNFEVPIYARAGWIEPLDEYADADTAFDQDDILSSVESSVSYEDEVYAQPFYGESSFLMYRKDVLAEHGVRMPAKPTWNQVADAAAKIDGKEQGMAGICLRGQPGWGQVFAPLTTVVNTYGGTWFDEDWNAQVDSPEFTEAVEFYVDLVRDHGQRGAPQAGFAECLNSLMQGESAMWYDATSAAGLIEAEDSPHRGKFGYAAAPVAKTDSSGWLYSWVWSMQSASEKKDEAWQFISWASSKEYEELVGEELGWSRIPSGKRTSTYENEDYLAEARAFADPTRQAIESADPEDPGVQPRPAPGVQFVGIPEFPALGTQVSQEISAAIAGQKSVPDALARGQELSDDIGRLYRDREGGREP